MAEIVRVTCPVNAYTLLSNGNANVSFQPPSTRGGRMAFAASQPATDSTDYKSYNGGEPIELGSLGTTKVWWRPNDAEQIVEVIRG